MRTDARRTPVGTNTGPRRPGTLHLVVLLAMAHAPFVPLYGFLPTIYQYSGSVAVPLVLAFGGIVMVVFSAAHAGMARRVPHGGGLHALVTAGLGPVAGLGAAALALVSYLAFLAGVLVFFGGALRGLVFALVDVDTPLWCSVVAAAVLVAATTRLPLRHVVGLLAVLGVVQVLAVVWLDVEALANPAGGTVSFAGLDPASLLTGSFTLATCLALTAFVGTEVGLAYRDEADEPARTVPRATTIAYALVTVVLVVSATAISVALGPEDVIAMAQGSYQSLTGTGSQPLIVEVVLRIVDPSSVGAVTDLLTALLAAGGLAVGVTFAHAIARQVAALARDGALPAPLAHRATDGRPTRAALIGPVLSGVAALAAVTSDSSWMALFQGMIGGLGVTLLIALTALAIVVWFLRRDEEDTGFLGWETPVVAGAFTLVVTGFVYVYSLIRLPDVLGDDGAIARWLFPLTTLGALAAGLVWGATSRVRQGFDQGPPRGR
ncbi:APC family permease [Cryptosporangium aurantiacum]|uniref:Amino acid transporter n=1 Tax=Cryptosporangium aurantiacum TaxID=134849 RepID=A0A1M7RKJ3_9ACTN|nr:APC family permease [Cryptosporangium aurantiacum]SHN46666.1 Amino acid transporter [Cryptosporangium aurantiacum]